MKEHQSVLSNLVFLLRHVTWWALPAFCLLCAGCFLPRDYSAWSNPNRSAGQYAILPVLSSQVRITVEDSNDSDPYEITLANSNIKNQEEVARIINQVLDTIAAGENNSLEGPSKVDSTLKLSPDWKNFQVFIQDPGPLHESWKRKGFATIYRTLGYQRVLCVIPTLRFEPNLSFQNQRFQEDYPYGISWDGRVAVEVNMMDLTTVKIIEVGTGEADFHGAIGVWGFGGYGGGIAIPYAFGKAFDRAVDQAIRQALAEFFAVFSKGGEGK